jgi:dephospho-CoA kinase
MTIGVTGGIGSGKSTVCDLFREWGADYADADKVGHAALEDLSVQAALITAFGENIRNPDGTLDRRKLGKRAFASDVSRTKLTNILWPEVGKRLEIIAEESRSKGSVILVIEASLLLEKGDPDRLYEAVVVVTAGEDVRVERATAKLGITEEEVRDRMRHQMPEEEKIERADHVIVNNGSLVVLEQQARSLWLELSRKSKE